MPYLLNTLHFQEAASDSEERPATMGLGASPRLFVMPAVGAITNLIYSPRCCEHTHLWAACKTDSCKGSISIWWFYLSVFLHAKNKCCKKCEMRSHFSARIHHMLHALAWYSIIIVHQPSNFSYVSLPNYKLHLLLHCMASLAPNHRRIFRIFLFV